jgi:glycosyltransferase involved in cell wall biosynthesis
MISFIMMAKNEEARISDAILALVNQVVSNEWELVIIDDGSSDKTLEIANSFSKSDSRVKVFRNIHKGKVLGTGYGYSLTSGEYIKCIDADDVLLPEFFNELTKAMPFDAHCHSALVTDETLKPLALYAVNVNIVHSDYKTVVENWISLPKWSWTFHRKIADIMFPLHESMPIEDVWMSFVVKYYAKKVKSTSKPLYLYRQHTGQDYGGIVNYDRDLVVLRASRSEKIIEVLENNYPELIKGVDFSLMKNILHLQTSEKSIFTVITSRIPIAWVVKVTLMLHFPKLAGTLTKLKWKFDDLKI